LQVWDAVDQVLIDRLSLNAVPLRVYWTGAKLASAGDGAALDVLRPIDGPALFASTEEQW
jgi:hypothetical protein